MFQFHLKFAYFWKLLNLSYVMMTKSNYRHVICIILFLNMLYSHVAVHASEKKYYLKTFDISNGLSQNTVNCILQDKLGFMWFGTKEGLNRFDGLSFTVFKQEIDSNNSLEDSYIRALYEDDSYRLWIGTSTGVYVYMMKEEIFVRFDVETLDGIRITQPINNILRDKDGIFWISTEQQGLFSYEESTKTLSNYKVNAKMAEKCNIRSFLIDSNNRFWFMVNPIGLFYSDDKMKTVHHYQPKVSPDIFEGCFVTDMLLVGKKLYIVSNNSGLVELNTVTGRLNNLFTHDKDRQVLLRKIISYDENEIWIGTESGMYILNLKTSRYTNITYTDGDPYGLSDNAIHSIYRDKEGGVWIGTYFGGVNYYPQQYTYFEKYYPIAGEKGMQGRRIREFCETETGKIFVGTEDGGLHLFNQTTKEVVPFGDTQIYHNIHGLCLDNNKLWVGTYSEGLYVVDTTNGAIVRHYKKGVGTHGLINDDIFTLYKDKDNCIWVGADGGLQYYDRKSDCFITVPDLDGILIRDIKGDATGNLYCGTAVNGFFYYEKQKKLWHNYKSKSKQIDSLPQNNVTSVFIDSRSRIWLTTQGGGFCQFLPNEGRFQRFTSKEGLANDVTYQILEDDDDNLWISTNEGLVLFNQADKTFFSYKIYDGLPSKQFHYKSSLKSDDGLLYFGSIDGFVVFDPSSFKKNENQPTLVLTDFLLFNKKVKVNDNAPLKESIIFSKKIRLTYDQNSFSIGFASLDYYAPELTQFHYMLEGFDKEWMNANTIHSVTYSNIRHGKYTFKIKASNSSGVWSKEPITLEIEISPPWWKSTVAHIIYALLVCLFIYWVYRYIGHKNKLKEKRQLEIFSQEKEKEIYIAKIDFFTNIAHEIRTPLTLIKSPLENVIRNNELSNEIKEDLNVVDKNTNRLLDLTNQLLDFRKIEKQGFQLTFARCNVSEILRETYLRFSLLAKKNNIEFAIKLPKDDFYAVLDRESVIKIVSNLFSNAVKHAESLINVELSFGNIDNEPFFNIIVKNDGMLIPEEQRDEIFKPFVQYLSNKNSLKNGTGLGLALSRSLAELHKGYLVLDRISEYNQFRLSLPIIEGKVSVIKKDDKFHEDIDDKDSFLEVGVDNQKPLVMIVEDDKELLIYMERFLSSEYNVIPANNGQQALKFLEKYIVNLIVSDVMMPQMDGFELCKIIKSDLSSSHIPIILLTAKTGMQAKIEGMELGADAYIEKPFDNEYLFATISNLLSSRKKMIESFNKSPHLFSNIINISKADEKFMQLAYEIIQRNMQNPYFSKEDLADELNLSRSSLYRKIKGVFGVSPNEFIRLERLKKATQLLVESGVRVSEVCYLVGFNSPSYFSKCFFKQYGVLPKDFISNRPSGIKNDNLS